MSGKKVVTVALVGLSLFACPAPASAQAAKPVRPGDQRPVNLPPAALAEANEHRADLSGGSGFWSPEAPKSGPAP